MSTTATETRWRKLLELHRRSGLTNHAFADKHGVNPRTLAWWRSELKKRDAAGGATFTALVVAEPMSEPTVVLALDDHRAHVVVDEATDLALLKRLLTALC